uniref:Uncharacterized protein n=1 Tax=Pristionchus pacificus TaxID=54126 RepID=A0A2A6B525_PRIPA|eukprot:PDM60980.1 hypothetical protein PRIPAC_54786 [Pristionchus pacificus]
MAGYRIRRKKLQNLSNGKGKVEQPEKNTYKLFPSGDQSAGAVKEELSELNSGSSVSFSSTVFHTQ